VVPAPAAGNSCTGRIDKTHFHSQYMRLLNTCSGLAATDCSEHTNMLLLAAHPDPPDPPMTKQHDSTATRG
jgi:hypothetical protein